MGPGGGSLVHRGGDNRCLRERREGLSRRPGRLFGEGTGRGMRAGAACLPRAPSTLEHGPREGPPVEQTHPLTFTLAALLAVAGDALPTLGGALPGAPHTGGVTFCNKGRGVSLVLQEPRAGLVRSCGRKSRCPHPSRGGPPVLLLGHVVRLWSTELCVRGTWRQDAAGGVSHAGRCWVRKGHRLWGRWPNSETDAGKVRSSVQSCT